VSGRQSDLRLSRFNDIAGADDYIPSPSFGRVQRQIGGTRQFFQ
jgi:hypothetical protein